MNEMMTGHCLCKAVDLRLTSHAGGVSACHCAMCRRWSGGATLCLEAPAADVTATGPVQVYRSSHFAERAFCGRCGTHLWIRDDDGDYDLMPGLFDAAAELPLLREIYTDRAFACMAFRGDHPRVPAAEHEAGHNHVEGSA
ncbi:GFA family protein [Frigidibacter sp. ROC022]|uniref:GFA family protein n=1 Tax=Frigidibacter sp. ROC022 TaxID=2971796 RepID=UPI00215A0F2A|nr:GFA family protein [Frigidibacter sp. ROC022]MCR8724592.1 GFA family protein [Frigidibacter sp. ROC022]